MEPVRKGLPLLPPWAYTLAYQPKEHELGMGVSEPVEGGVGEVVRYLRELCATLTREPTAR